MAPTKWVGLRMRRGAKQQWRTKKDVTPKIIPGNTTVALAEYKRRVGDTDISGTWQRRWCCCIRNDSVTGLLSGVSDLLHHVWVVPTQRAFICILPQFKGTWVWDNRQSVWTAHSVKWGIPKGNKELFRECCTAREGRCLLERDFIDFYSLVLQVSLNTLTCQHRHTTEMQNTLLQGCHTHVRWGPHQPCGCLQRAECNFRTV